MLHWVLLSLHRGDGWWKPSAHGVCPSYDLRLSIELKNKYSQERPLTIVQDLSYLQQTVNSFMTLSPDTRMTARRQTHREHGTHVLLVALKNSRVDERQHGKQLVRIPKTNSRFLPCLPWAHPHTDAVLKLTAKEWE